MDQLLYLCHSMMAHIFLHTDSTLDFGLWSWNIALHGNRSFKEEDDNDDDKFESAFIGAFHIRIQVNTFLLYPMSQG